MAVAKHQIDTSDALAEGASELFLRYVREPMHDGKPHAHAEDELADAFAMMVQAATWLVGYHVERTLMAAMQTHIAEVGTKAEQKAFRGALTAIDASGPA